ncbi:hypothetical protein [Streptomyces sp. PSKA30]|uniref:hypothetical protein n=1 Tax=Streptomyces sp. PSKA30 TaxID=2874597 RepID=UPI001CD17CC8|nr:hypothetical protein [Streptomyces sp. PSKA30]MBZ9642517.1 hypothetical protein [Streptomyces sp. PSKA30]
MPRGRHRHSPPLHRLLPPSAIAGVSLVCALGPWVFTEPTVLRGLAAAAAVTAVAGAVVLRRWDTQAGKQVADLTRARASDEWRHEERVAELETDLEESRELRVKLEQRLRAKRAELAGLRNEHAALLRRYATAETERASALEGRRLLEIEAATPARALPPVPTAEETEAVAAPADPDDPDDTDEVTAADETDTTEETDEQKAASGLFSPEGSRLFLRARAALIRFDADTEAPPKEHADQEASPQQPVAADAERVTGAEAAQEDEARGKSEAADGHERAAATTTADTAPSDDNAAAESVPATARPAAPVQQPSGHFTVPTAVAVVPASAPVRRPTAEGGFDFFGTKANASAALEAVQNEDLADVVGQEALDLHKAEAESEFKPAGEESRGIGQVIDLTAHDETEQIDVQELRGLRSAVS